MRVLRVTQPVPAGRPGDDQGAVAVVVALLLTAFMVLAAFAIDIGNAYAQGRQVSVAMDSAALAAAAKVGEAYPVGQTCSAGTLSTIGAQGIAQAEADRINAENRKDGLPEAVQSVTVTCADNGNAIQVDVANTRGVDTALAGIIGIETINPGNYAAARFIRNRVSAGLRPWAVCRENIDAAREDRDETFWTAMGNWGRGNATAGICGSSAPGQWGGVDFDGGNNDAGDLVDWTWDGYPGSVTIPDEALPADPGVSQSGLPDAFRSLINQVVLFPSVDGISGTGNGAVFDAVGIASVMVCGIVYNGIPYNTTLSGDDSDCWREPEPPTVSTVVDSQPLTPVATTGTIARNSTTLILASDPFAALATGPGIEYRAVVRVPGAGQGGSELTGTITFSTNPATLVTGPPAGFAIELPDRARTPVTNGAVTIELTRIVSTTTTNPGYGLWYKQNASEDSPYVLADQIQFRWVNYSTSGYSGPGSDSCNFDDPNAFLCIGQTVLWQ